ncbi:MAG: conjugal transfer protein TraN [Desulfosarcina sp.]|nr:conjugal transfer protein TraN [Desulfobacterales bacterium]
MLNIFLFLLLVLFLAQTPDSWAAVLIYQHTGTEYSISVFKSEAPALYTEHNISLSSITGDQAIFIYNGNSYTITCNGTWHNLNPAPDPEIQNMISCLPDTETFLFTGSKIDASIRLFDQNLYNSSNIHLMAPEYNDPFLAGTSEAAPYCLDDNYYTASACKWEVQNISDPLPVESVPKGSWIVYARTDSDLSFTIEADPVYPYAIDDIVCAADLSGDDNITSDEINYCQEGLDKNEYLCPMELINCEWSTTQPECIGDGIFIGGGIDMCEDSPNNSETEPVCSNGYVFNEDRAKCQREPLCTCGTAFVPGTDMCEGFTCPHGCEYGCIQNQESIFQCSPYNCFDFDPEHFRSYDTIEGENDKKDDGIIQDGICLGTFYIFSGNDKRCRTSGIETSFNDCCEGQAEMYLINMEICSGKEVELTQLKEKGLCHYIGQYCSKRLPLIGCVQHKKTYCCFHSKLGRIINEQGRSQLKNFGADGGWDSPKNPNCRGFTTDEFQMLNFSLIDLSEWYSDITTKPVEEVQNSMKEKMDRFYE